MYTRSSWQGWKKKWFYWETTSEDRLSFVGKTAEKCSSWDSIPKDLDWIAPYIQAIKDLKKEGRFLVNFELDC